MAGKFLDQWCTKFLGSKILSHERKKQKCPSGFVEGLNRKAKLTARKFFGFRNPEILNIALYDQLGKLPTPGRPAHSAEEAF